MQRINESKIIDPRLKAKLGLMESDRLSSLAQHLTVHQGESLGRPQRNSSLVVEKEIQKLQTTQFSAISAISQALDHPAAEIQFQSVGPKKEAKVAEKQARAKISTDSGWKEEKSAFRPPFQDYVFVREMKPVFSTRNRMLSLRPLLGRTATTQVRTMATLKEVSLRLKSIQNIGKITKSMKMIASTKVNKAEKAMEQARVFGTSSVAFLDHTQTKDAEMKKPVIVTCSSDRGLCGGIHSSLAKASKRIVKELPDARIAVLGIKARSKLNYDHADEIVISFDGVCKFPPTWLEASSIVESILSLKTPADGFQVVYNSFRSVIAFDTTTVKIPTLDTITAAPALSAYEIEDNVLDNYHEFLFANTVYWALAEGFASEFSARRTAMENATKNADEMVKKLTLTYNRSRQAVITNELCDIITGASALE
ncbi:atp3 gamma subunit of the F1 sector of mitochondrial F1F0 ATP synthase [Kappamyces sp. JEL0680]|nr:atp3 gamma subunit of the F1 sector of mitochondrial F1F0 ATP synthase [Kappamyces sp. JEL0680]